MKLEVLISTSIPAGLFLLAMLIGTWQICWAWTLLGAVLLDMCCLRLKEVIRQARPIDPAPAFVLESEGLYGMPSEHAAFVTYLFAHLGMRLLRSDWDHLAKSLACLALASWGAALVTTRYVYGAHSLPQFHCRKMLVQLGSKTSQAMDILDHHQNSGRMDQDGGHHWWQSSWFYEICLPENGACCSASSLCDQTVPFCAETWRINEDAANLDTEEGISTRLRVRLAQAVDLPRFKQEGSNIQWWRHRQQGPSEMQKRPMLAMTPLNPDRCPDAGEMAPLNHLPGQQPHAQWINYTGPLEGRMLQQPCRALWRALGNRRQAQQRTRALRWLMEVEILEMKEKKKMKEMTLHQPPHNQSFKIKRIRGSQRQSGLVAMQKRSLRMTRQLPLLQPSPQIERPLSGNNGDDQSGDGHSGSFDSNGWLHLQKIRKKKRFLIQQFEGKHNMKHFVMTVGALQDPGHQSPHQPQQHNHNKRGGGEDQWPGGGLVLVQGTGHPPRPCVDGASRGVWSFDEWSYIHKFHYGA
eukprot:s1767_g5.t1